MNVMNTSGDDLPECPLCMEPLEVDDLSFFPCTCGYQICRFCWHRIRTDENELCPACRKAYPENPADFKPLTQEQISALKAEKRQRDQQRKQKITENRKHLANVRVVQKNLVFVVGLPPRLADAEILKKHEYFGKYGKIHKVVINPSTTYAGVQGPSASAYVTYVHNNDALRAIQSVNNITIDGRSIKTSLGTTKYCSHFMKNQVCPKPDCMYLHELGDTEASFTKEEMHQLKHQEYEKRLHDSLIAQMQQQSQQTSTNPISGSPTTTSSESNSSDSVSSSTTSIKSSSDTKDKETSSNGTNEAWPSLSTSPIPIKEGKTNGKGPNKENTKSEANRKHEKAKGEKTKGKVQKQGARDKVKAQMFKSSNINNNLDDELGETDDTDDTPSISSTTDSGTISESDSGKSSPPSSFPDPVHPGHISQVNNIINVTATTTAATSTSQEQIAKLHQQNEQQSKSIMSPSSNSIIESNDITSLYGSSEKTKDSGLGDTSARLSKLSLFDDNSSFFSRGFNSFSKHDGSSEHSQAMNNAQLPDLLNGTVNNNNMSLDLDPKQLLKNLGNFGSMSNHGENTHDDWESAFKYLMKNNNNISKHYEDQQQQEEWLRYQELKKHSGMPSGLGLNQFNMFNNDNVDNMFAQNELSRMMFNQQYSQQQQQQRMNHNNPDMNHVHPSMSKFFDFHKNQQQQQQNQFMMNSNPITDQLNMANLMDSHHRMGQNGGGFMDQAHLQKQRLMNKYDNSSSSIPFNTSNSQNRMHNNPSQYTNQSVEDDLGFDPFKETQKALAELINDEATQQQQQQMNGNGGPRSRMPPPGFNHIQNNSFNSGFGTASPRSQSGSKFPFMQNATQMQQQQQLQNNWPMQHMGFNQNSNDGGFPHHQNNLPQQQHKTSGFGNSFDQWIDPAIVSFRQYPFNPQQQQQAQNQANNDLYMSHQQGFGMNHGMNMQNNLQSQTSPAQVFSHSNVLNNYHLNNMGNYQNFDKFPMPSSIPPPGFQSGNSNGKKTECIN
jgi:CCR4-NOT transcription complex subunit 4